MLRNFVKTLPFFVFSVQSAFADAPAPGPASPGQPQVSLGMQLFPFIAMFAVVYLLMIRPQQKKMKEQQQMLANLQHGDEVITSSGILGKVTGITDKVVTLEIADGVRIKMLKGQIAQVVKGQIKDIAQ